jgi:hypothetical protein
MKPPLNTRPFGDHLALDVHVVNDLRTPVEPAIVDIEAKWAAGSRRWRFGGEIPADDCVKVGTIEFDVPRTLGALTFDLTLIAGDVDATNHYATAVTVVPN